MNTLNIKKMTENNNKFNEININAKLEVLDEVRDKCGKNWYDRVYLCYEDTNFKPPNTYSPIKGFDCYRYNSFKNADYAWDNHRREFHEVRHTMIPICIWVPEIFDRYILNWKLRKIYWGGQICTGRGYNRFK